MMVLKCLQMRGQMVSQHRKFSYYLLYINDMRFNCLVKVYKIESSKDSVVLFLWVTVAGRWKSQNMYSVGMSFVAKSGTIVVI